VNADQREEIAASVAAHAELGPRYDAALAEGLVERIGEEIDRRVDARLYGQLGVQAPKPRRTPVPGRLGPGRVLLALGSMGLAVGGTAAVLHPGNPVGSVSFAQVVLVMLIWVVVGAVNIAYANRN
jgi:hypothetical protein